MTIPELFTLRLIFLVAASLGTYMAVAGGSRYDDQSGAIIRGNDISTPYALGGTTWQVEDIEQDGIIDYSMVTIQFSDDGRITGRAGCNRYFGTAKISGNSIEVSGTGATQMACADALMQQERRYFEALSGSVRLELDSDTWLVFYDSSGIERLRAIRIESVPEAAAKPEPELMDQAMPEGFGFVCPGGDIAAVRFLGPDTIELKFKEQTYRLQLERSASGAKYTAGDVLFWNKGESALIGIGGTKYECTRSNVSLN